MKCMYKIIIRMVKRMSHLKSRDTTSAWPKEQALCKGIKPPIVHTLLIEPNMAYVLEINVNNVTPMPGAARRRPAEQLCHAASPASVLSRGKHHV